MNLSDEEILQKLATREIKPRALDELVGTEKANALRLAFLERMTKSDLTCLGHHQLPVNDCKSNINLMIGAAQIPLGYTGPLPVVGKYAKGSYYVPLATTEGGLVASIDRGCSIIRKCGHVKACVIRSAQTRSILLKAVTAQNALEVTQWIEANWAKVKEIVEKSSRFFKLLHVEAYIVANNLWVRLEGETGDAMGMNMITLAGEYLGRFLEEKFPHVEFLSASGNVCSDKKASSINLLKGRGKYVIAEIIIPQDQIREHLKASSRQVWELNNLKNWLGGMISGSLGFNAHFANAIAAIYLATGQDIAHVVEGSQGFTTMDLLGEDLYVAVTLPCIQVGTHGGGTHLPTQQACLRMLGVYGTSEPSGYNALVFAEVVAATVLAGELSLIGALASHDLGKSHVQLNRRREG
jgi:hydroxymethylglutaryl-CoA reductase (NADPH)